MLRKIKKKKGKKKDQESEALLEVLVA